MQQEAGSAGHGCPARPSAHGGRGEGRSRRVGAVLLFAFAFDDGAAEKLLKLSCFVTFSSLALALSKSCVATLPGLYPQQIRGCINNKCGGLKQQIRACAYLEFRGYQQQIRGCISNRSGVGGGCRKPRFRMSNYFDVWLLLLMNLL